MTLISKSQLLLTIFCLCLFLSFTQDGTALSLNKTIYFDGDRDYISVSNTPELNPIGGITIEAWVNRNNIENCETIVGKSFLDGYWLGFCSNDGQIRYYTSGLSSSADGQQSVQAGVWTHIAVTFDGSIRRYYINGVLDHESTTPSTLPVNSRDLGIGADTNGSIEFTGSLAEVRIWNFARTQDQIRQDMIRIISEGQPGLVGVWHLEANTLEAINGLSSTGIGDLALIGSPSPAFDYNPIPVPLLSSAPSVNGICSPGEYTNLQLPIWYDLDGNRDVDSVIQIAATSSHIYLCSDDLENGTNSDEALSIYIDLAGDGTDLAQEDDYRITLNEAGTTINQHIIDKGDGNGGYLPDEDLVISSVVRAGEFNWGAEIRLPLSALTHPNRFVGLQVVHHNANSEDEGFGWPQDFSENNPNEWPKFTFDTTSAMRPDSQNPSVDANVFPTSIMADELFQITARATDDVDISTIDINIDGRIVHTCNYAGLTDRQGSCQYDLSLEAGSHTYSVRAVDHRGRLAFSPIRRIFATVDGEAPTILVSHTPDEPALGQTVTINATAADPSGIDEIIINYNTGQRIERCNSTTSCSVRIATSDEVRVIQYWIEAIDNEGLRSSTGTRYIIIGNSGPDSDGDGLSDVTESYLCTSPTNIDSDRDTLRDDWEILGLHFPDGESVDLPSLGANPCYKDIFVQLDYEEGLGFSESDIQLVKNNFRRQEITLHVEQNERPKQNSSDGCGPGFTWSEVESSSEAATLTDDSGDYYFHPKRNWTHIYGYFRWESGRSGSGNRYFDIHACGGSGKTEDANALKRNDADLLGNRFIHELGHSLGLGHGGWVGSNTQQINGNLTSYKGGWNINNFKVNYQSIMNYGYLGSNVCFNSATKQFSRDLDYSTRPMPSLSEIYLNERPNSPYIQALQDGRWCSDPNAVPAISYTCQDPDETEPDGSNTRYVMVSDGTKTLARIKAGSSMQTTNLPTHNPGIDWNCDGVISSIVSENINGTIPWGEICDGIDNDGDEITDEGCDNPWTPSSSTQLAPRDYDFLPAGYSCNVLKSSAGGFLQPASYRNEIQGVDCPDLRAFGTHSNGKWPEVTHDYDDEIPSLGNLLQSESCDGYNNDNDDEVDEGCPDSDNDLVIDVLDNCPATPNADQADHNNDGLGDTCQSPSLDRLILDSIDGRNISLRWKAAVPDYAGYSLYRRSKSEATYTHIAVFDSQATQYNDIVPTEDNEYIYILRVLNLNGQEGLGTLVATDGDTSPTIRDTTIYLPIVVR